MFVCISEEQFNFFCETFSRIVPSSRYADREIDFNVIESFDTVWGQVDIWLN